MRPTKDNSLEIQEVAERYEVGISTIARWLLLRKFPAPHRPFGKRLWLIADLELFDEWQHDRSTAIANGDDPDNVPRPCYSIPVDGPIRKTLVDGSK